ncbi:MAG: hypothetical protein Q8M51_01630 [Polaromonas sp.]|uniref:hypothetical protein n=1 Tax=Polaromonas sp. TaxID=1869339 RepID=UPI002731950D|nr:hypothetical protein [Polaromonas sp.]MDP1740102.1 hypothetical protein [Polaromonas sp.]MDP3354550.1 hypothetical protein [Polaromonas sp.]
MPPTLDLDVDTTGHCIHRCHVLPETFMKKNASHHQTPWRGAAAVPGLCAVVALLLLTGCPQSKLPDVPPSVPQPKASLHLFHHSFEI